MGGWRGAAPPLICRCGCDSRNELVRTALGAARKVVVSPPPVLHASAPRTRQRSSTAAAAARAVAACGTEGSCCLLWRGVLGVRATGRDESEVGGEGRDRNTYAQSPFLTPQQHFDPRRQTQYAGGGEVWRCNAPCHSAAVCGGAEATSAPQPLHAPQTLLPQHARVSVTHPISLARTRAARPAAAVPLCLTAITTGSRLLAAHMPAWHHTRQPCTRRGREANKSAVRMQCVAAAALAHTMAAVSGSGRPCGTTQTMGDEWGARWRPWQS